MIKKIIGTKILTTFFFAVFMLLALSRVGFAQTSVTLYSVSPTSAAVGAPVTITGTNLLNCAPTHITGPSGCNVQFHDINLRRSTVSGNEDSNTQVSAVVAPELCPGSTTIKVGELTNFSNSIPFTILDSGSVPAGCRVITSISPTSGTFGTTVTINGRNLHSNVQLYDSSYGKVDIAGTMNAGATQVTFVVPGGTAPGAHTVRVGPNGNDVSNGLPFTVIGDKSAPYISNIKINNITTSGATVLWDTSEPADGQIEFCLSLTLCGTTTSLAPALVKSHLVNLSGLTVNTRYYFWIKSKDAAGNLATGGPMSFRTLSVATPTPTPKPVVGSVAISNFKITGVTRYTATATWDTDKSSNSRVVSCAFGIFCYKTLAENPSLTTSHVLNISSLKANTNYSVQAQSSTSGGENGVSEMIYFKTEPNLTISNIQAVGITSSGATITWNTNYPSDSGVIICTYFLFCYVYTLTAYDAGMTLNHSVNISGLLPSRKYYFRTLSKDSESTAAGSIQSFVTLN